MKYNAIKILTLSGALAGTLLLGGCLHDDDDEISYRVELTNLSNNQPLSPALFVLHEAGYQAWSVGAPAGDGLERLAEGGDPGALADEARASSAVRTVVTSSAALAPGATSVATLSGKTGATPQLTVVTMLVNTNDGFTGLGGEPLRGLTGGDSVTLFTYAYDAGTEANTETAATVPGPAGGGEGYNPARDDTNRVTLHGGVVTSAGGLSGSALDQSHRFDNPVARVVISRQ
ncbi:MAG TPA: hypothetical protein ENJ19_07530 [Gammaproteobacteria bacterium]|nr:hypothetical protein [Gammaproteobacteria bacterium]